MSARTHNFRIGLFVLIGAVLFIAGLLAMGLKSYFGEKVAFETYVPGKVENLSVGALVKLRGVTIGKVSSIDFISSEYPQFNEQAVVVRFEIPKNFRWNAETNNLQQMLDTEAAHGLRARVQGQGFLGANILALGYVDPALYPVEPVPWTPKNYYIPSAPSQFNRVFTSLEKTLRHVENLDLAEVMDRAEKLIDAANGLVANINRVDFDQLGTNANSLVVEFRETNRGIQRTLTDAQGAIKDARGAINSADLAGIRRDTAALEAKLTSAAAELKRLLSSVDTGELNGSLANVRSATDELIVLLHNLERQPSSVLFSKPPKPVMELELPPKK
jgi:ABC-type transporter Mla subunit MlaD